MLGPFDAGPALFRSGWFVESLATQTLVVFVIRTHRVPFWRSRPSRPLLVRRARRHHRRRAAARTRRSRTTSASPALPADFFVVLAGMVVVYLFLVELTKRWFFERMPGPAHPERPPEVRRARRIRRRGRRWERHEPRRPSPVLHPRA